MRQNNNNYIKLNSIKAIKVEKRRLRENLRKHEEILLEDWEEIKKPFRFVNIAISTIQFLLPARKGKWIPMLFSGYQLASSFIKSIRQ